MLTPEQHTQTNVACPFLENHRCGIYAVRPIACRTHHEAFAASKCLDTFKTPTSPATGVTHVIIKIIGEASLLGIASKLSCEKHNDTGRYEFVAGVGEALSNPAARRRFAKKHLAFPGVRDRQSDLLEDGGGFLAALRDGAGKP